MGVVHGSIGIVVTFSPGIDKHTGTMRRYIAANQGHTIMSHHQGMVVAFALALRRLEGVVSRVRVAKARGSHGVPVQSAGVCASLSREARWCTVAIWPHNPVSDGDFSSISLSRCQHRTSGSGDISERIKGLAENVTHESASRSVR